jgi:haloacid dehalogenase superfamily, subfamily IA, variant 1 with third motif having Dx(3-4)D or Dx(3-4)E
MIIYTLLNNQNLLLELAKEGDKMYMYKYIIFDIDGTILDTEFAGLASLQRLLREELDKEFSFEELSFSLGIPGEVTLNKLGIKNVSDAFNKWYRYSSDYFHHVKVFDDIRETLEELKSRGVSMGIVTSKTRSEFDKDFIPFGIVKYFEYIICADDTDKHKPNPEPILKFIELSEASKQECIYIGDTKYDSDCAFSAGVDFALALWGAKSSKGIGAKYVLKGPREILELDC